eukprot:Skav215520  [mRNA]  locus=scaffold2213:15981:26845:- [translate_table: standard]
MLRLHRSMLEAGDHPLELTRTTQMWMMPGGDRHYQGLEGYVRRCSFLYMSGLLELTGGSWILLKGVQLAKNVCDLFWLVRHGAPAHLYPWNLVVGASSGFVAQTATYPLDTLRRRWQHTCAGPRKDMPQSLKDCAKRIYMEGGPWGFYRGWTLNSLKLLPELAVLSGVYFAINASGNIVPGGLSEEILSFDQYDLCRPDICAVGEVETSLCAGAVSP